MTKSKQKWLRDNDSLCVGRSLGPNERMCLECYQVKHKSQFGDGYVCLECLECLELENAEKRARRAYSKF